MPTPNAGESREDFVSRCIPIVMHDGSAENQDMAVAMCNGMWEGKSLNEDTLVYFGEAVKALGNGKIGGYLVRFTTDKDPDLTGEFFTKDTDFGDAETGTVYFEHGLDPVLSKRVLGKAIHKTDDFGIWAETQLKRRDKYEQFLYSLAERGKLGWSSGTMPNLVQLEKKGKATWIKYWPLGLDDTLTIIPAEPRNTAVPLKSLSITPLDKLPMDDDPAGDATPAAQDGEEIEGKRNFVQLRAKAFLETL